VTLRSPRRAPTWHRAPTRQDHVDPFALVGDGGVEGVELTVDGGGVATVVDSGDGSWSGGTYMAHGGLWFRHTRRERT
jgi:hypothetical protein